jgi:hypothetical protein
VGALLLLAALLSVGCQSLVEEPTPVPGAAATLARSSRTPIPTSEPSPSPAVSPVAARPATSPVASPSLAGRPLTDEEVARIEQEMQRVVSSADLPDIERFLLDRVSLSSPAGGQVLERAEAATWLRDHAGPGIEVTSVDLSTQTETLEVHTQGWPRRDPVEQGIVRFSLRRYGASGRPAEQGEWKIDVMGAE